MVQEGSASKSQSISKPIEVDVSDVYTCKLADSFFDRLISPRRMPFPCLSPIYEGDERVAGITMEQSFEVTDHMLAFAKMDEYVGCATFERKHPKRPGWAHRPIPHTTTVKSHAKLLDLFNELGPSLYKRILAELVAPIQTYDKHSRIGAPVYSVMEHKLQTLLPYFQKLLQGDLSLFDRSDVFTINNIRLQAEPRSKEREYAFLGEGGRPYLKTLNVHDRTDEVFKRIASRVRLVFNYPLGNLLCQVLDTAIHNWFLKSPTCHHNMSSRVGKPLRGYTKFLDVKHFDRNVGVVMPRRCEFIGGLYSRIMDRLLNTPFLVPADDGRTYELRVNRNKGYIEQLGSGVSAVAPVAKEILILLYCGYHMKKERVSFDKALDIVLGGGHAKLGYLNYGDDNVLIGEEDWVEDCFAYLQQHFTVEEEKPARFLGHYYDPGVGFFLGRQSYINNFYLAERGPRTRFRPYPFLGYELRRKVFEAEGEPFIRNEIFAEEDKLLAKYGYEVGRILDAAKKEREELARESLEENPLVILGKEYLLSEEQKQFDPRYDVLGRDATGPIIEKLTDGQCHPRR